MKIISFLFQHSRKAVLLSVAAAIFSGICNAALLAVVNLAIRTRGSFILVSTFATLCFLLPLARFASERLLTKLGQDATYELRVRLCHQILGTPLRELERLGPPRLLAALTEDIPTLTNVVAIIPLLCVNVTVASGCLVYLGLMSWRLLLIVLVFMCVGIASYQLPILRVGKILKMARREADDLQNHFRALLQGTKELKIHRSRKHAFMKDDLEATATALRHHNMEGMSLYTAAASCGQILVFIVIGLILFVLPLGHQVPAATLTGYTLTLLYLVTPLQMIMNNLPQLTRATIALKTVEDLGLTVARQQSNESEPLPCKKQWRSLEFRSVTHTYHRESQDADFVLGPVDLVLHPGEIVFLTGGNGSGKTTFLKLITGLYAPETGHIVFDGETVDQERREGYSQYFSVVFSDFYLFDTLHGLLAPKVDCKSSEYLERLQLSHKVHIENGRFSTTELSQGQRKRLALLTAFLEDRPIYVFDEWAADQDPYFKNIFYMQLLPELKAQNKAVIVISHDERYYHAADRIIKLEDGQVASDTGNGAVGQEIATGHISIM